MDFTNYLTMRSSNIATMMASNVSLSTLTGSTVMATTHITAPTVVYSTLFGSSITVSTMTGSTLHGSTVVMSSMMTSFLTLSTLIVSSINNNVPGTGAFSTLTISSLITASTITASSINVTTGNITASSITSASGTLTVGSLLSIGNRLLGTTDTSPSGNFWMGLNGSGSEATRLAININGNATTGAVDSLKFASGGGSNVVTMTGAGNCTHVAGDASYTTYGPNTTWSGYLVLGATSDKSGVKTAQIVTTDGNLYLDAGNGYSIFYGYYPAYLRSLPNSHEFHGSVNVRNSEFYKYGNTATSYVTIMSGTSTNSPYVEFFYGGSRRGYIGYATATNFDIRAENGSQLTLGTASLIRLVINTAGDVTMSGRECVVNNLNGECQFRAIAGNYGVIIRTEYSVTSFGSTASGDQYGPMAGMAPLSIYHSSGLVVCRNLKLRNLPEQSNTYARILSTNGSAEISQSQGVLKQVYRSNSVGWGGGVNIVNAFYKYNSYVSVRISGMCSGYTGGPTHVYPTFRLYSQSGGTYTYYETRSFTNNGYNHVCYPFDYVATIDNIPNSGWFDLYFYSGGGLYIDSNDCLNINVTILPAHVF